MDFQILSVLEPAQVDQILGELQRCSFIDGKATAQGIARDVKNNLQANRAATDLNIPDEVVRSALFANQTFQAFAFPRRIRQPLFSRYERGMNYGSHVDASIFNDNGSLLRADLAVTVFLSPPDTYDGGELVIELPYGEEEIKLQAGEAIVYSAGSVHRVAPVTRGVRMAAVTWVQTAVQDERMRALLFDLYRATKQVEEHQDPTLLLSRTYNNLLRMVSEF